MILRNNTYTEVKEKGDLYKITHAELVPDALFEGNYELRKDKRNTWNLDKNSSLERLIARLPTITWLEWYRKYPELRDPDPNYRDKFLFKLLSKSENEVFKTVKNI